MKDQHGKTIPTETLCARLHELSGAVCAGREAVAREFTMRIPAEPARDADLVLSEAAKRLAAISNYALGCARRDIERLPLKRDENGVRWYRLNSGRGCQEELAVLRVLENITERDGWVTWGEQS